MQTPVYSPEEALTRETFLALMWSLSYPGRAYALPASGREAYLAVGETLLDLETSYFTPDQNLALALSRTGARALPPERAQYHFYPELFGAHLETVEQASVGTMLYPDRSATLIIGCTFDPDTGRSFQLSGPGIATPKLVTIGGLPDAFWELRRKVVRYPLGWDMFLIGGDQVVGLARTTILDEA